MATLPRCRLCGFLVIFLSVLGGAPATAVRLPLTGSPPPPPPTSGESSRGRPPSPSVVLGTSRTPSGAAGLPPSFPHAARLSLLRRLLADPRNRHAAATDATRPRHRQRPSLGSLHTFLPLQRLPGRRAAARGPVFFPRSSSSVKLIGCRNPKCSWIHPPDFLSRCRYCPVNGSQPDCSPACPPYTVLYGSGSTGGLLLSESLQIAAGDSAVANVAVGCSLFSSRQPPAGIAGFGRGPASLPSQLGLRRFSYCLVSRRYDDSAGEHGTAELGGAPASSIDGLSFTPLLQNPSLGSPFSGYYYLCLRRITVDGKKVKIPHAALVPLPGGDGGTIIDSGTTFTYMEERRRVAGRYNRSAAAEELTGLRPCFSPAAEGDDLSLPELAFHFKGGAAMRLPVGNYFAVAGSSGAAVCLTVVTDAGEAAGGGPSIILGSFQQQNYYMVFDLDQERIGFRRQSCLESR
ncbi:unnamed protein product [Spirodela intermedia]|uniref:Peptidase A1 domain-containing protein n=1 Tax=Spirodela intermedia TaxID=51605 RepID=A0A7I8IRX9_SPIIN|nr:unnamed protein product [Spirodela intermedia]CAA6660614.1 unnamed protein product [Spirodela intermedia]